MTYAYLKKIEMVGSVLHCSSVLLLGIKKTKKTSGLKKKKKLWKLNQHFVTVMGVGLQMLQQWGALLVHVFMHDLCRYLCMCRKMAVHTKSCLVVWG